jgi:hypothetical protein
MRLALLSRYRKPKFTPQRFGAFDQSAAMPFESLNLSVLPDVKSFGHGTPVLSN